jgi:hypothetical protein
VVAAAQPGYAHVSSLTADVSNLRPRSSIIPKTGGGDG